MRPIGFESWRQFSAFCTAREFVDRHNGERIGSRGLCEKAGEHLAFALKPLNLVLREFRNPAVIAALTATALLGAAVVFYPTQTFAIATRILPFLKSVRGEHIKAALYVVSQATIAGIGLRAFGRFSNPELVERFLQREVIAVPIGAVSLVN